MKKAFLASASILSASILFLSGCNINLSNEPEEINKEDTSIVGTIDFITDLNSIKVTLTKSGELTEDEVKVIISPALSSSISYLEMNGYDFKEDFENDDPRIIWVATALAEYDKIYSNAAKTTVGGCVLQAIGVADIVSASGK